ncbi:MAG: hypothetical protein BWK75_06395 [Candidatus Altiarchaeales archaeon A3]|nr:MAG: hypothetical protein BWK75_06395 [Candidatus Altiarchaeales archaeon A3]
MAYDRRDDRRDERRERVEYEVIKTDAVTYGNNKFLEIARKKVKGGENENEFVSISKGYFTPDGSKKYKEGLGFPADQKIIDDIVAKLSSVLQ